MFVKNGYGLGSLENALMDREFRLSEMIIMLGMGGSALVCCECSNIHH